MRDKINNFLNCLIGAFIGVFLAGSIYTYCRYLLEFGEVSNTYNFTLFNIVSYLVIIPIGTTFAYRLMAGGLNRR